MSSSVARAYLNPEGLIANPGFSQAVVVEHPARTIYVSGQNAVDSQGQIVGDTLAEQTVKSLRNLETALRAAGAELTDVVSWHVLIAQGQDPREGFAGFQQVWGTRPNPPAISVAIVAALGHPRFLCEIDAIAVV
jgi:enamine deaminase RidA (YjgF/YER057c/UK114 family)